LKAPTMIMLNAQGKMPGLVHLLLIFGTGQAVFAGYPTGGPGPPTPSSSKAKMVDRECRCAFPCGHGGPFPAR
jgi:hypothetical protein